MPIRLQQLAAALLIGAASLSTAASAQTAPTAHVADATDLMTYLAVSGVNVYGSNAYITWDGTSSAARTSCSTFLTLLFGHSYGWLASTFKPWFGTASPNAAQFHDTIAAQNGFLRVDRIDDMDAGDILAVIYPPDETTSGHVAILAAKPTKRTASAPVVTGTTQYDTVVIDSSASGHGSADTRYRAAAKTFTGGIGKGTMRLYVNALGTVVGYTWSTYSNSDFYTQADRDLVVGRLNR